MRYLAEANIYHADSGRYINEWEGPTEVEATDELEAARHVIFELWTGDPWDDSYPFEQLPRLSEVRREENWWVLVDGNCTYRARVVTADVLDLFLRYAREAPFWGGEPPMDFFLGLTRAERRQLGLLETAGLVELVRPGFNEKYVRFTSAGRGLAAAHGLNLTS